MNKNNKGYIALSLAIIVSITVMAGITYFMNRGELSSKQFVSNLKNDREGGVLKHYLTQTAALLRSELSKGINPISPSKADANYSSSQIDLKCQDNPDYKNPRHQYLEPNPPTGKVIVYTCKNLADKPHRGAILTTYFKKNGKIDPAQKAVAFISYEIPIGQVVEIKGKVVRSNILAPIIDERSPLNTSNKDFGEIYLHDKIVTDNSSYVRIRLKDKSYIHVGPNSEFYFKKFLFEGVEQRKTLFTLIKGKIQAAFAKKNANDELIIDTPTVSLGVRGTEYVLNVKETKLAYEVTADVLEGSVEIRDLANNQILKNKLFAGQTFSHHRLKSEMSQSYFSGDRRYTTLKYYQVLPAPTPDPLYSTTTSGAQALADGQWVQPPAIPDQAKNNNEKTFFDTSELIDIRRNATYLYAYYHGASRNQKIFDEAKNNGQGWKGVFTNPARRASIINEPLFVPRNMDYNGINFSGNAPTSYPYDIAMMIPSSFNSSAILSTNFALVYPETGSVDNDNSFVLVYPASETLLSVAQRFVPGPYSQIQNNIFLRPLQSHFKFFNGELKGCDGGECNSMTHVLHEADKVAKTGYIIGVSTSGSTTVEEYPPRPDPTPIPGGTPPPGYRRVCETVQVRTYSRKCKCYRRIISSHYHYYDCNRAGCPDRDCGILQSDRGVVTNIRDEQRCTYVPISSGSSSGSSSSGSSSGATSLGGTTAAP